MKYTTSVLQCCRVTTIKIVSQKYKFNHNFISIRTKFSQLNNVETELSFIRLVHAVVPTFIPKITDTVLYFITRYN